MIKFARKTKNHPRLSFEQFDMAKDLEKQAFSNTQPFDHFLSFYAFMWLSSLQTCIRNFYKLLVPNGDMLAVFPDHLMYDVYKKQSLEEIWASYMMDILWRWHTRQYSKNSYKDLCNVWINCDVTFQKKYFTFESIDGVWRMRYNKIYSQKTMVVKYRFPTVLRLTE